MDPTVAALGIGSQWEAVIATSAAANGVSVSLVKAIISQESGWNPNAVNLSDPSYGLMQVNTKAHPDVTPAQMLDPTQNIPYGTAFLGQQVSRYGLNGGISAYNAGHPISGNAAYVANVLAYKAWYEGNDPASMVSATISGAAGDVASFFGLLSPSDGGTVATDGSVGLDTSGGLFTTDTAIAGGVGLVAVLLLGGAMLLWR